MISPRLAAMAAETPSVAFYKVDIDDQGEIAQKYAIRSVRLDWISVSQFSYLPELDAYVPVIPQRREARVLA